MERNAARSSAWLALHLSLTFSRLSVLKMERLLYPFMHSNFGQASYLIKYGVCDLKRFAHR